MKSIKEYLDAQGKTIESPKNILDQTKFSIPDKPQKNMVPGWDSPKEQKEKEDSMFAPKASGETLPYVAKTLKVKEDQPLGDINPENLFPTEFDVNTNLKNAKDIENIIGKNESIKQNAPSVLSESGKSYHPDPAQAIKYVMYLANNDKNYLKSLVVEAKNIGCLSKIIDEINSLPKFI